MFPQLLTVSSLAFLLAWGAQDQPDSKSEPARLAQQSTFVFKGTVQKLNAATMADIPVTESTVIVKVDNLLKAPKEFYYYGGKEITVLLSKPKSVNVGQQVYFFTNGAVYGKSIAVREIGRLEAVPKEFELEIAAANQKPDENHLKRRLARAELVVVGKVESIKPVEKKPARITEHDPQWQEAVITVHSVEKGELKDKTVVVLYPASRDVMWYKSPKFKVGQEGLWILHRDLPKDSDLKGFTALDPADVHPKDQVERVRKLIKAKN